MICLLQDYLKQYSYHLLKHLAQKENVGHQVVIV